MERKQLQVILAISMLMPLCGCGQMFGRRQVAQLKMESERLLAEYRYERDRADRLDVQNRALTTRLGLLEADLAVAANRQFVGPGHSGFQHATRPKAIFGGQPAQIANDGWRSSPRR